MGGLSSTLCHECLPHFRQHRDESYLVRNQQVRMKILVAACGNRDLEEDVSLAALVEK